MKTAPHVASNRQTVVALLAQLEQHPHAVEFAQVMDVIAEHYVYRPTRFCNGSGELMVVNGAGTNEGSCRLFAFAQKLGLSEMHTLACFGRYYREDVLGNPRGSDHANIRAFMRSGWAGIQFDGPPLTERRP